MKVLIEIDGKPVSFQNDVKIIYDDEEDEQLHMTYTHEGLVEDLIHNDRVVKTNSVTYVEICEELDSEQENR